MGLAHLSAGCFVSRLGLILSYRFGSAFWFGLFLRAAGQSDNTVRESKNQIFMKYLLLLLRRMKFIVISMNEGMVGHSHDFWDQLFGIIVRAVRSRDSLQDPDDVCAVIQEVLQKPSLRSYLGHRCRAHASRQPAIGDWRGMLGADAKSGMHIELSGGLLVDATANHSFTFLARMGFTKGAAITCRKAKSAPHSR